MTYIILFDMKDEEYPQNKETHHEMGSRYSLTLITQDHGVQDIMMTQCSILKAVINPDFPADHISMFSFFFEILERGFK